MKTKPVFNYSINECNKLFKLGVHPIGCGFNKKTQSVYHVFEGRKRYFDALETIKGATSTETVLG